MSTTVARPGTTGPGRRLVGMVAVGLAVVIAAGFVFALNSGNEPTVAGVQPDAAARFSVIGGETNQVPSAARAQTEDLTLNIERYRLEKAGLIGISKPFSVIGGETNQVPSAARVPTADPTLNIERYKLEMAGVIGTAPSPTLNIEKYKLDIQNATRALEIASQRYEAYAKFLAEQAMAKTVKQQAMWDQRFDDLVERFENQVTGGNGLSPLHGRF